MIVVVQCAAKKRPDAGYFRTSDGKRLLFVGDPTEASPSTSIIYVRPDDPSDSGGSWRDKLVDYNRNPGENPLRLSQAGELYANPSYGRLLQHFGADKTYILSAGWGLINAAFLTPAYDITFSMLKPPDIYKRRKTNDIYCDFHGLPENTREPIFFFGGKSYVPLFCELTRNVQTERTVFYNSDTAPIAPGCTLMRFPTRTRTNWHYECVSAFLDNKIAGVLVNGDGA